MIRFYNARKKKLECIKFLIQEIRWIIFVCIGIVTILALWGFHPTDPSWSYSGDDGYIKNPIGSCGAWISDVLFYLFGGAAWLLGLSPFILILSNRLIPRQFLTKNLERHKFSFWLRLGAFLILLACLSSILAIRFHRNGTAFPMGLGGLIGTTLALLITNIFSLTNAIFVIVALLLVSWRVFSGLPWVFFFENIGNIIEILFIRTCRIFKKSKNDLSVTQVIGKTRHNEAQWGIGESTELLSVQKDRSVEWCSNSALNDTKRQKYSELGRKSTPVASGLPPLSLFDPIEKLVDVQTEETLQSTARSIESYLKEFGIEVRVIAFTQGPVVTRYEIELAVGIRGSQISSLASDLARSLALKSVRVLETMPGKACMALEVPNAKRQMVRLAEILKSVSHYETSSSLEVILGKDTSGLPVVADLSKMPHLLLAGTTGSGKSVSINAMILSILYKSTPNLVRLILIDPKMLELSIYDGIPHLLSPVITNMGQVVNVLCWSIKEMERRYQLMSKLGARNLASANEKIQNLHKDGLTLGLEVGKSLQMMPYIVIIVDELADLMMVIGKKAEELIIRLAQKARAAGLHLILATQRPSVDVLTGLLKANIPTRIAFQVSSKVDSRVILDHVGAEALLGKRDMLYLSPGEGGYLKRVHGAFVTDDEISRVTDYLRGLGMTVYDETILLDDSK